MTSYEERLATFIAWPHAPPTPQPKDLAAAGFKHAPTKSDPDRVKCTECKLDLDGWEPHDNAFTEHASRSPQCIIIITKRLRPPTRVLEQMSRKSTVKEATQVPQQLAPISASDIGFFDPSLQHDFPELRLYHDVNVFVDQVQQCDQYLEADIVQLLPKCLRGAAYMWYQGNQETLKDADLTKCMQALIAKFKEHPQETSNSATRQEAPQSTLQQPRQQEYHKCTVCSASFSSISRLLSHSQMATCGKSSCNHCEEVFDSKNKLHDHIRSRECQKSTLTSAIKSIATHKSGLTQLSTPEKDATSDADIAIKKTGIKYSTHATVTTPPPTYRAMSPPPPTYEPYKKPYLTVADLYMRYAPLSRPTITRPTVILPTMSMQDLYEKFHGKEKLVIPTPNKTLDSPTKQHATRQNLGHRVFERFGFIRSLPESTPRLHFSISPKSIAQGLTTQQQRHIKSTKHSALTGICINDVRKHTMSPVDLVVAVKTSAQHRTYGIPAERGMNTSAKHMRCSDKV